MKDRSKALKATCTWNKPTILVRGKSYLVLPYEYYTDLYAVYELNGNYVGVFIKEKFTITKEEEKLNTIELKPIKPTNDIVNIGKDGKFTHAVLVDDVVFGLFPSYNLAHNFFERVFDIYIKNNLTIREIA